MPCLNFTVYEVTHSLVLQTRWAPGVVYLSISSHCWGVVTKACRVNHGVGSIVHMASDRLLRRATLTCTYFSCLSFFGSSAEVLHWPRQTLSLTITQLTLRYVELSSSSTLNNVVVSKYGKVLIQKIDASIWFWHEEKKSLMKDIRYYKV